MKLHTFQLGCLLKANTLSNISAKCLRNCVNHSGDLAYEMKHLKTFTDSVCIERTILYQLTRYNTPDDVIVFLKFNLSKVKELSVFGGKFLNETKNSILTS